MTFQSTVASVKNIRKQRQLELELVELDRQWHIELKFIARERLGVIKQLSRFNQEMRELDHFRDSMHGKAITRFADRLHGRLQQEKELKQIVHKFDFEPDPVEKINLTNLLLRDEAGDGEEGGGAIEGEDIAKVWTSKDLNKQRVQLQKTTFEQCMAEKRNRRRPFWDKAVLGSRKKKTFQRDRNGFIRNLGGGRGRGGRREENAGWHVWATA
ncbi:uncharacterized protein [Littorina saxatilis]|uniref:Uncharacterized protein n=1 Tax=Littorina saxatilis TaxID=31220 RepID=A0AAN9BMY0_9CAEN